MVDVYNVVNVENDMSRAGSVTVDKCKAVH